MELWSLIRDCLLKYNYKSISEGDECLRYEDVLTTAEAFSAQLAYPCYGILCNSELNTAISLLSCMAAGVIAIPLSMRYGEIHCRRIIEQAGLRFLITDDTTDSRLSVKQVSENEFVAPDGERPALIMFTSGTTGHPKGAMISQDNLLCNLLDIHRYFAIQTSDRILISRPLYHCAVLTGEFLISILCGLDVVFYSGAFNPYAVCQVIKKNGITVMGGTPTLFYHMSAMEKRLHACGSLRVIVTSGECMTPAVADSIQQSFPNVSIYNVYGLTEASPRVAYLPPSLFAAHCTSVGYPLHSLQAKVVSDSGEEVPPDTDGELLVKGASVMMGYYREPQMTAERISDGWLHTGDVASMSADGLITIKCRKDNMIIKAGINIYPQEIENAVKKCSGVREAYVYGQRNTDGRVLIHLLVEADGIGAETLSQYCRNHLPVFEIPDVIRIVDSIPKNGSGKIIRKLVDSQ